MKKKLLMAVAIILSQLSMTNNALADSLDNNGILRNDDGSVRTVSYQELTGITLTPSGYVKTKPDVCEAQKAHLPSIRELATKLEKFGAKGIKEPSQITQADRLAGYADINFLVAQNNVQGLVVDEFYFNKAGYKAQSSDFAANRFWSVSEWIWFENKLPVEGHWVYIVNGASGAIEATNDFTIEKNAVFCIQ